LGSFSSYEKKRRDRRREKNRRGERGRKDEKREKRNQGEGGRREGGGIR
jgi:hypothetical protein